MYFSQKLGYLFYRFYNDFSSNSVNININGLEFAVFLKSACSLLIGTERETATHSVQ